MTRNWFIILTFMVVCSCGSKDSGRKTHRTDGEILPAGNDYATHFRITDSTDYTLLEIIEPWQGATGVIQKWYMVRDDHTLISQLPDDGVVLKVPLTRIVCMSATHVSMVSALVMGARICGVSGIGLIYDIAVRNAISSGSIREVGYDENMNRELLAEMNPDIVVAYGVGSESVSHHLKLAEMGLKVMYNADYLETHPLGKAEWIKVFGLLFGVSHIADSIFKASAEEYNNVKEIVAASEKDRPLIMLGLPWKESWYISPGNSYIGKMIEDAGGRYLWNDLISEFSMPYNLENVYVRAIDADFWINPGSATRLSDIVAIDHRLSTLKVFSGKRIYNNNKMITRSGANDYWETGTLRPGLILKDMAVIFDGDLLRGDTLRFFRQLQ